MKNTRIISQLLAKKEHCEEFLSLLTQFADKTRKEKGNISFEVFQDNFLTMRYVIGGSWKSQEDYELHINSNHYESFRTQIFDKIDNLETNTFKKNLLISYFLDAHR